MLELKNVSFTVDTENGENRAEQTFGGMQELKPLN